MQQLSQSDWKQASENNQDSTILDVRTDMEVAQGIIPGAKQINIQHASHFMDAVKQLDTSKHYFVYCRSGARSAQACMIMDSLGFENTYNLVGGILDWEGDIEQPS